MNSIVTHVIPTDDGWVLKRGREPNTRKPPVGVFPTRAKAVNAAREIVKGADSAAIYVYDRHGFIKGGEIHGMPPRQKPHVKSKLGTKAIREAVNAVINERLAEK